MQKLIEKVLQKYGTDVLLRTLNGDTVYRGFMQHTASLGWKNMQPVYSPLGEVPRGQYRLILPPDVTIVKEDILRVSQRWYTVRRVEKVWYQNKAIYCWCLCEERGEPDNWGFQ